MMNGKYDISRDLCFKLDKGGRRGHDQKLFKRRYTGWAKKNGLFFESLILPYMLT